MDVKKLSEKIFDEIQRRQTSTTSILREARTLGKLLGDNEFDWVEKELKGYEIKDVPLPSYRFADVIETRTWSGHLDTTVQRIYSDWLKETAWTKWPLFQPVNALEDLQEKGFYVDNTNKIYKTLEFSGNSKPIYQRITVSGQEIKKTLDSIQDRVSAQISEILTKPQITKPSNAILEILVEKFSETRGDVDRIIKYLETGEDHLLAARSCRPILYTIINFLKIKIPKNYIYTDGKVAVNSGEKSKIKFYLEQRGGSLYKDKNKLIFLDDLFREVYDISSKADKNSVNKYESNLCVDKLLKFLEQLYRYTDLFLSE